jgi:hypothetical protein
MHTQNWKLKRNWRDIKTAIKIYVEDEGERMGMVREKRKILSQERS